VISDRDHFDYQRLEQAEQFVDALPMKGTEHASTYLREELLLRMQRRPRYSQRAFARDLGVSQSFLSLALKGERRFSMAKARDIALRLDWPIQRAELFQRAVQRSYLRADQQGAAPDDAPFGQVDPRDFDRVSHWYYFALVELTELRAFRENPRWIAKTLGISELEAEVALRDLVAIGLLERRDGRVRKRSKNYEVPEISSAAIRLHHRQSLSRAAEALENQGISEREFGALTLAFDVRELAAAKEMIRQFQKKFSRRFGSGTPDSVYQLGLCFYRQDREMSGRKK
jgi:uncharacterized protein (TIGR02147 family)